MYAIKNAKIYTGEEFLEDKILVVKEDRIFGIFPDMPKDIKSYDLNGAILAPGFIDLQVNGCGGIMFNYDISLSGLKKMQQASLKNGTTSFLPTLTTTTDDDILKSLKLFSSQRKFLETIGILGLHIEGPYISSEKRGIHDKKLIRVLSDKMIHKIAEHGKNVVRVMTLAPEVVKVEHLKILEFSGVHMSMGHTNATYEEAMEKIKYFKMATHLYNAMRLFSQREPGVLGAIFSNQKLYTGIIVDGVHSHFKAVKMAKDILKDKLFLITDALTYDSGKKDVLIIEGEKILCQKGKCLSGGGTLAGSTLTMRKGVENLVKKVGLSLEDALKMASTLPAKAIGIDKDYGYLKEGYFADMVILNKDLSLLDVISKGKFLHKK